MSRVNDGMAPSEVTPLLTAINAAAGSEPFELAIILGSGLGALADQVETAAVLAYADYDCFPPLAVAGHAGRLVVGRLDDLRVLVFAGRFHLYQGLTALQAGLPVRIAHRLGCRRLLLTNAAGGIDPELVPGHFLFIEDHLNLLGDNPLRGLRENTFLDLSTLYARRFWPELSAFAVRAGIPLRSGVLAAVPGPSYETPAEVRALRLLGAAAVGMSTVSEAILGRYLGMEVAGLSFIANRAAGLAGGPLSHEEVLAAARDGGMGLAELIRELCRLWQRTGPDC